MIRRSFYYLLFTNLAILQMGCKDHPNFRNLNDTTIVNYSESFRKELVDNIEYSIKVEGNFNYNTIKDSLFAKFDNSNEEPLYFCKILLDNSREYEFHIPTATGIIEIYNCKPGCIETYESTTGIYRSEESHMYMYNKERNHWFQDRTEIINDEGSQVINYTAEKRSIDGSLILD